MCVVSVHAVSAVTDRWQRSVPSTSLHIGSETNPAFCRMTTDSLSTGIERPEREVGQSPHPTEVEMRGALPPLFTRLYNWLSVKHRGIYTVSLSAVCKKRCEEQCFWNGLVTRKAMSGLKWPTWVYSIVAVICTAGYGARLTAPCRPLTVEVKHCLAK